MTTRAVFVLAVLLVGAQREAAPETLAVVSDLNGRYGSTEYGPAVAAAVDRILELRPDAVLCTGDMVAGQRARPPLEPPALEAMWAAFRDRVSNRLAAAGIPLAVVPGNHDASAGARFAGDRRAYAEVWRSQRPRLPFVDDARYPFRYALRVGEVLVVGLDATAVGPLPAPERDWLRAVLARHGESSRHRVVFAHLPVWPVSQGREREALFDEELDGILREARVDAFLAGHHHAFFPGVKDGVRHVTQGGLGSGPRALIGDDRVAPASFTVLTLTDRGIGVEAWAGPDFRTRVDRASLPGRITWRGATLVRDDRTLPETREVGVSRPTPH